MARLRFVLGWLYLLSAALPGVLFGQIAEVTSITSTPIAGSGHDYLHDLSEIVNPANGSVSIRIAAPTPHERRADSPIYAYTYDTNGQFIVTFEGQVQAIGGGEELVVLGPNFADPATTGGNFTGSFGAGSVSYQKTAFSYCSNPTGSGGCGTTIYCTYQGGFVATDPSGGRHTLGVGFEINGGHSPEDCISVGVDLGNAGGDEQYKIDTTCYVTTPPYCGGGIGSGLVVDLHGDALVAGLEDTNGNYLNTDGRPWSASYSYVCTPWFPCPTSMTFPGLSAPYTYGPQSGPSGTWYSSSTSLNATLRYNSGADIGYAGNCNYSLLSSRGISGIGGASSVNLPNGQQYALTYDPAYGYIKTITYPSKAKVEYTWAVDPQSEVSGYQGNYTAGQPVSNTNQTCIYTIDMPRVQRRVVKFDGVTPALEQDFVYSTQWNTNYTTWTQKTTTVTTKDLVRAGHPSFTTVYTYVPMANRGVVGASTTFPSPVLPVESTVAYYDTSGNLLRTVTKVWNTPNQLAAECVTLDNNQTAGTFYKYAQYSWGSVKSIANTSYAYFTNLVTDKAEYDYGTVVTPCQQPSSTPVRETKTTYASLGQTPYWQHAPAIVDRPHTVQVYGNGTLLSETDYAYDETALGPVSPAPYGHDETNYGPSASTAWARGNATTITKKCFVGSTSCTNSVWKIAYDTTGQPVRVTDANGNIAAISYADGFASGTGTPPQPTNQYVTTITRPVTNGVSHIETFQWNYNQGELAVLTDENGKSSFFYYNDPWNRLTEADYPDGGVTKHAYVDTPPISVTTCELINGSASATCNATSAPTGWETNVALKDGVGHVIQTQLSSDPDGATSTATTYDGIGMPYQVYNPTRCNPPATNCGTETTWGFTTYTYDALGRTKNVLQPDGSIVQTTYSGNQSTVIDEAGKSRESVVDALGRMTQVFEDPAGLKYETDYTYDALNNLLSVTQNGSNSASARYRTFTYDSLSRLLCAANPEVQAVTCPASTNGSIPLGAITYGYDANGNLLTKTAPAPNLVAVPGTAGTGSASVGGTEQSVYYPAIAGSGTITLSGSEQSTPPTGSTGSVYLNFSVYLYLGASVSIVVNGSTAGTATVPKGGSGCMVAQSLTSAINGNSSSLVTASSSCPGTSNYGTVQLSSKSTGSQTNYPISVTCQNGSVCSYISTSGGMGGGTNGTPDTGKVSVTVNGFIASAQYGSGSTPGSIATALASALSASGSPVTGSANGSVVTMRATQSGANSNYPFSSSVTWNSQLFSKSSFISAPSGSSLTGGLNAVTVYDNGTVWLTVNGCQASTTYGQSSTAAGLASTLANGLNAGDCGVNATAAGSGIALTATSIGSNTDYSLSSGSSTNLPAQFSSPAFTVTASGSALSGGSNEQITLTTTTYTYDALNRPLSVTHSNPSNANAAWAYDGTSISACPGIPVPTLNSPTNLIGRRSSMCSQESTSSFSYDPMGRIIAEVRSIGLNTPITNASAYTYYKDGSLNKLTYPSGDVVTYTVGGAGRVTQISDTANNFVVARTTPPMYAPHGALLAMTQGSGIITENIYNDRLQPILLSAGPSAGPMFSLCYDFHLEIAINNSPCNFSASPTGNNGNVFQVLNNIDSTRSATFAYDSLNRIMQANTVNTTSTNCWGEAYTIDAWGNLTNIAGASGVGGNCYTETLNAAPATTANHLNGYCYDAAGNLVLNSPCPSGTFTPTYYYDAENRLYNPQAPYTYFYDADGVRIRKAASATQGTMYWPSPSGQYLMETNGSGTINEEYIYFNGDRIARIDRPTGTVHYYFSDELQSASLITDPSGNVQERYYYYPYGGLRTSTGSDSNHYLFTGKERDSESGLDEFGARYYASSLGRFMIPDWAEKPTAVPYASFGNPQSLNLYSYVNNNPTTTRDPDGHELYVAPELQDWVNEMRTQSSSFSAELAAHEGPNNPDLTINTGSTPNDPNGSPSTGNTSASIGGGPVVTCSPNCVPTDRPYTYKGATVTVNDSVKGDKDKSQDVLGHEVGHVHDARTNTDQYHKDNQTTQQTKGKTPHDERPEEQRANQYKKRVNQERREWRKQHCHGFFHQICS